MVEHDGGDLAALAGAGAVAEHPAAPEAHRGGQHLAVVGDIGGAGSVAIVAVVLRAALHGLPAGTDAVVGGEMAGVGFARKHDAFELGVGQEPVGHHAFGQHRPVGRHGMRHRGHGGGLHQRRGMSDRARHPRDARPPRFVGAGIRLRGRSVRNGVGGAGLDDELGDRSPFVGGRRRGSGIGAGAALRGRRPDRLAEQIPGRAGRDGPSGLRRNRQPGRNLGNDGVEKFGGVGGAGLPVDVDSGLGRTVDDGEPGVEAGAAACIGAAVDGHGEDDTGAAVHGAEGIPPVGIAGDAVGGGDGGEPAARRQHGEGRPDMAEIGVVADAVDARRRGKRRVHQHDGGPDIMEPVGDGFRVEGGSDRLREQMGQEAGARGGVFVEMEIAPGLGAHRAFGHDREHAGAGRGLQHGVARADRGGLERGIGERQRRRELLQADLLLGALRVRRLQRGDRVQHRQHPARPVRSGSGLSAHGTAVTLHEQHGGGFGGLVGVLPDPGAGRVRCAEGLRHRIPEDLGIERPAGLQDRQQDPGRREQGVAPGEARRFGGRVDGERSKSRTREGVRRRMGVEHGDLRAGMA